MCILTFLVYSSGVTNANGSTNPPPANIYIYTNLDPSTNCNANTDPNSNHNQSTNVDSDYCFYAYQYSTRSTQPFILPGSEMSRSFGWEVNPTQHVMHLRLVCADCGISWCLAEIRNRH